jgi:outer membrane protein
MLVAGAGAPTGAGSAGPDELIGGPLTLEGCMRVALARNPDLVSSAQAVTGAEAGLVRARSPYYPQVSLGLTEGLSGDGVGLEADGNTERTERVDVTVRQTVWQRGLKESVEESAARVESAEFSYAAAVQSLLEQVAGDFYGALAAGRLLGVAEAGVDSARRHVEEVQARIEAGAAPEVDEFTAQDDLARADLALIDARGNVRVAHARLKTTMGVSAEATLELRQPPAPGPEELPALEEALAIARENRPDILSAAAAVEAGRRGLEQAEIRRGPVADISGRYDWGYWDWTRRDSSWDVALSLSWPLLDGKATEAEVTSARAALVRSEAQLESTRNRAGLEVETALADVERSWERVGATATSVAAAQARLRAAEGKYQQGVGILLEVTDARAALTDALASQVRAEYDYRAALVGLERATGRLAAPGAGEG